MTGLACLLLWLFAITFHVSSSSVQDMVALTELKTGFHSQEGLTTWTINTTGAPCAGWRGVTCAKISNVSYVVSISIPNLLLGGEISPAVGLMTHLQMLDLSQNELTGNIPPQIANLTNLTTLNLSNNNLSGSIALNWSGLTQLTDLMLTGNSFQDIIPTTISAAASLTWLQLDHNNLSGTIPPEIFTSLHQLQYLAVEYNGLTGSIPEEICDCTTLRAVYAAHNSLSGWLPVSIGNLVELLHFEVQGNQLSGPIPAGFGMLTGSLSSLNLSDNDFTGLIPPTLATKFNSSSFADNPGLCGPPLPASCSPQPGFNNPYPMMPGNGMSMMHNPSLPKATIIEVVIAGVVGLCLISIVLFLSLRIPHRRQQSRSQQQEQGQYQNWFSPAIQETRNQGHYEMFNGTLRCTYDQIVYNAGHYDTAHVLGKGRFAIVYKSVFSDDTQLAVKVLKQAQVPASFERDVELLASIRHPNVVHIRGMYCNPIERAIFYDYLPTGTLYGLLHSDLSKASNTLPNWATRVHIALGVARGLHYLHRGSGLQLLHKDVKSTNILLETSMTPRLTDIGLIQLVSSNPQEVVETPGYTAPEVLITRKYTEKSDVYSFGMVLLELITGKYPSPEPPTSISFDVSGTSKRQEGLRDWVASRHAERRGREVVDEVALRTCALPTYIDRALDLAVQCVDDDPRRRPAMSDIATTIAGLDSVPSPLRSPSDAVS